jgi:hypothetical protein
MRMFSRKSLLVFLTAAVAGSGLAQTPPVQRASAATTKAATAPKASLPEGGTPTYVRPETPEQRHERLGTNDDPGPNPDEKKTFYRFGKQYHIERYERRWASFDGVEEGQVRPFGFVNVPKELYQQNEKYVWVWMEDKPKDDQGVPEVNPPLPEKKFTDAQLAYTKAIRPEFQDLSVPMSTKTLHFEESSTGLPNQGSWRNSLAVGDMNGDGFLDLIAPPERNGAAVWPAIFLGDGKGHWKLWQNVEWPYGVQYGSVAVADFNKDGKMDVAFGVHLNGVRVFLGDGKGKFTDASKGLPVGDYPTRRILVADADQDGYPDVIAISEGPTAVPKSTTHGKMVVFFNRNKGTEWLAQDLAAPQHVFGGDWAATGKFNNDKYPDFVGSSVYFQGSEILYLSGDKPVWEPVDTRNGLVVPFLSYYFAVAAGHMRSATKLDDAILSYVRFWPSTMDPALVPDPPLKQVVGLDRIAFDGGEPKRTPIIRWPGTRGVWGVATGDFDGDGNTDIVFTKFEPREFVILLGDGKGGFTRANLDGLKAEPNTNYDLTVADVNRDGRPDLIIMYESGASTRLADQDGSIKVFLNRGATNAPAAAVAKP